MPRKKREIINGKLFCPKCGRMVNVDNFYKLKNDQYSSWCKDCMRKKKQDNYIPVKRKRSKIIGNDLKWYNKWVEWNKEHTIDMNNQSTAIAVNTLLMLLTNDRLFNKCVAEKWRKLCSN